LTEQRGAAAEKPLVRTWWLYGIAALAVFETWWYVFKPIDAGPASVFEGFVFVALSGLCIPVFGLLARQFGFTSTKPGQIMSTLALGFVLWCAAEASWLVLTVMDQITNPSIADVFWLAGYMMQILALLMNVRAIHVGFKPSVFILWIALSILIAVVVISIDVAPLLTETVGLGTIVSMGYPFFDTVIIILALVIVLKFKSGQVAKPWAVLVLGFLLTAAGDVWYMYADMMGEYTNVYSPMDYPLAIGYIAFILSGGLFIRLYRKQRASSRDD